MAGVYLHTPASQKGQVLQVRGWGYKNRSVSEGAVTRTPETEPELS